MTAADIKRVLHLRPHPREGGWYRRTWESLESLPPSAFHDGRYPGPRRTSTAIYYLLEADLFSPMHRLQSDEIFHHYMGDAVEMLQLFEDGSGRRLILGKDIECGQSLQVAVQRGVWQGCRLLPAGLQRPRLDPGITPGNVAQSPTLGWALLGCTVSPGFEFEDYQEARAEDLLAGWPGEAELIGALTHR